MLGVACVAAVGARLLGIAVAEATGGDLRGGRIAGLIRPGARFFLGAGGRFGARISGLSRSGEATT